VKADPTTEARYLLFWKCLSDRAAPDSREWLRRRQFALLKGQEMPAGCGAQCVIVASERGSNAVAPVNKNHPDNRDNTKGDTHMLKKFLIASAAGLLLAACQQQPQMASPPPAAPLPQAYTVYFDTGQSALSPEATATVAQAAAAFKQGGSAVGVRGHTDTVGNPEFNLQLSRLRATAVRDALQRNGVPAASILTGAVGEQNLPVPTADNVPERRNRSVDIAISRQALMSDAEYCRVLMALWRRTSTASPAQGLVPGAMAECTAGRPANGIPVLEKALTDSRVALPSRVLPR
jgi:outer membrane protein OmpA-like peptidoglycan-associated protein